MAAPSPPSTLLSHLHALVLRILSNPNLHPLLATLKGLRNGLVFGTKVRLPHALVMTLLFRSSLPLRQKAIVILKATRTHALNLGTYVALYKAVEKALRWIDLRRPRSSVEGGEAGLLGLGGEKWGPETFIAGCVAGYYVFGRPGRAASSSVNQQLVLYVFARVFMALSRLALTSPDSPLVTADIIRKMSDASTYHPNVFSSTPISGAVPKGRPWVKGEDVARVAYPVFASVSWGLVMWLFRFHPEELQPSLRSSMRYLYENAEKWDGVRNFVWHNS